MNNYISRLDEIAKWIFDSFGILPGACSSTENLRHTTARMVAEALWPKEQMIKDAIDGEITCSAAYPHHEKTIW